MRIVVAPDKFKDALDAQSVGDAIAAGVRSVDAEADISVVPMADGGEGTLGPAIHAGFTAVSASVTGPLGDTVDAAFALQGTTAIIELAAASGLSLVPARQRNALAATSRGTGELIAQALDRGVTSIILAVGGSASTDGGAGLISALGARLLDAAGQELPDGGGSLRNLASIDLTRLDRRIARTRFVLATDVDNALLGPQGAASVFAPQKGATITEVAQLELGLTRFARMLAAERTGADFIDAPGAGAAGGVGFAALAVLDAVQRPGVDVVCEFTRLRAHLAGADLVITGEGSFDSQSLGGKTPVGVQQAAATLDIPVVAVCGRVTLSEAEWRAAGFSDCYAVLDRAPDRATSIRDTRTYLTEIGADIARSQTDTA